VPRLRELQRAMARALIERDDAPAAQFIIADGLPPEARLNIYRNTFVGTLATALRLAYPAVHRIVGAEFFEGAAALFIAKHPPASAYLDEYGEAFAEFLAEFSPAASLPYLPGVARLEWAVNRALHAPDVPGFEVSELAALDPADQAQVCFAAHPAVGFVHDEMPIDLIWRAVLDQDDEAMAAIDLGAGPVWLLVERGPEGVAVKRLDPPAWRFAAALFAGRPFEQVMAAVSDADAPRLLAEHLAAARFVGFSVPQPLTAAVEPSP